jgi:hypothetical protein
MEVLAKIERTDLTRLYPFFGLLDSFCPLHNVPLTLGWGEVLYSDLLLPRAEH